MHCVFSKETNRVRHHLSCEYIPINHISDQSKILQTSKRTCKKIKVKLLPVCARSLGMQYHSIWLFRSIRHFTKTHCVLHYSSCIYKVSLLAADWYDSSAKCHDNESGRIPKSLNESNDIIKGGFCIRWLFTNPGDLVHCSWRSWWDRSLMHVLLHSYGMMRRIQIAWTSRYIVFSCMKMNLWIRGPDPSAVFWCASLTYWQGILLWRTI